MPEVGSFTSLRRCGPSPASPTSGHSACTSTRPSPASRSGGALEPLERLDDLGAVLLGLLALLALAFQHLLDGARGEVGVGELARVTHIRIPKGWPSRCPLRSPKPTEVLRCPELTRCAQQRTHAVQQ